MLKMLTASTLGAPKSGKFLPGNQHPKFIPTLQLQNRIDKLQLDGLTVVKNTLQRGPKYRFVDAICDYCKTQKRYHLDSLVRGSTKHCVCRRNLKYNGDPRAKMLGTRYDCIVQRCNRDSHKQSKDYKGKSIKCLFKSREHFVLWALGKWPDKVFKELEFDRIDNNGDYSPENLRLATSRENHLNRGGVVRLSFKGQLVYWADWLSPYSPRRTQALAAQGLTGQQIIKRRQKRWWRSEKAGE